MTEQLQNLKYYLNEAIARLPYNFLMKLRDKRFILPLYHLVSNERVPHFINLSSYRRIQQFEKDLDFFQKNFIPIDLQDLLDHIQNKRLLKRRSCLLTFDDGYREIFEVVAPILIKRSIPAVFFLNTGFIDNKEMSYRNKASIIVEKLNNNVSPGIQKRLHEILKVQGMNVDLKKAVLNISYAQRFIIEEIALSIGVEFDGYLDENKPFMTTDQIRNLIGRGFKIGAHSIDHPLYREIPPEDQLRQTLESTRHLQEIFSIDYKAFAFPFTDTGVSENFYSITQANGSIDISFGTGNFSAGACYNNLQRQPMEKGTNAEKVYKKLLSDEICPW